MTEFADSRPQPKAASDAKKPRFSVISTDAAEPASEAPLPALDNDAAPIVLLPCQLPTLISSLSQLMTDLIEKDNMPATALMPMNDEEHLPGDFLDPEIGYYSVNVQLVINSKYYLARVHAYALADSNITEEKYNLSFHPYGHPSQFIMTLTELARDRETGSYVTTSRQHRVFAPRKGDVVAYDQPERWMIANEIAGPELFIPLHRFMLQHHPMAPLLEASYVFPPDSTPVRPFKKISSYKSGPALGVVGGGGTDPA